MDNTFYMAIFTVLGLLMGSFAGAMVWRLRARQLVEDRAAGEKVDSVEYKKLLSLTKGSTAQDRSRCLHCGHVLSWYDLLPLVSWLSTKGKCRYCGHSIGYFEPIIELATMALFIVSYVAWPASFNGVGAWTELGLWLVACVMLVILFAYDLRWFLLPNRIVFPLIALGVIMAVLRVTQAPYPLESLLDLGVAITILSGLYYTLWAVSRGTMIGFGDVKLGLGLALLLGHWPLAFIALFAANMIGCMVVLPGLLTGKLSRKAHVPFGPLLITGTIIAFLWGQNIIDWYFMTFA